MRDPSTNRKIAAALYEVHSLVGLLPSDVQPGGSATPYQPTISRMAKSEFESRMRSWLQEAVIALPLVLSKRPLYAQQVLALELP